MVETQLSLVVRTADFESFDLNQAFRERNGVRTVFGGRFLGGRTSDNSDIGGHAVGMLNSG